MKRTNVLSAGTLTLLVSVAACSSSSSSPRATGNQRVPEANPVCMNGVRDADETGVDCGGRCANNCDGTPNPASSSSSSSSSSGGGPITGVKDGTETDIDCGGDTGVKCAEGQGCLVDGDCEVGCSYAHKCISAPSCKTHLGGDTCGVGEVGQPGATQESCCRSLEVGGFEDGAHPGKKVYLDKYEITAGRVRAWIEQLAAANNGVPDVKGWIAANRPELWVNEWSEFLPEGYEGGSKVIARRLLGDPRVEDGVLPFGPGVILPPDHDEPRDMGVNTQFGPILYVDLHGNSCGTFEGSWGYPTYWYSHEIMHKTGQVVRADGIDFNGQAIAAKDLLDVKSMNCISNAMLAAFCAWDGGQLATTEVLDYVTDTPFSLGNISGCGTQYDNHGDLLGNDFSRTVQTGGRCAPVVTVNATFDGGDTLPQPGSILNIHNYHYPDLGEQTTHDKAWEIAAPGRASLAPEANFGAIDLVRLKPGDEAWADLNGNLNEAALDTSNGEFYGKFALKYRGIAYGSSRSDLNMTLMKGESVVRIQRPEAKAGYIGGRCMRFK